MAGRGGRWRSKSSLVVAGVVAVVVIVGVVLYTSLGSAATYQSFRQRCLSVRGDSLVTLSTTTRGLSMGAPVKDYRMGCRNSEGKVRSTFVTSRR